MKKTRKLLYSLYAAGIVTGASMLSGCVTRTVYVYPAGQPSYSVPRPAPAYTPAPAYNTTRRSSGGNSHASDVLSGILMGIGKAL